MKATREIQGPPCPYWLLPYRIHMDGTFRAYESLRTLRQALKVCSAMVDAGMLASFRVERIR